MNDIEEEVSGPFDEPPSAPEFIEFDISGDFGVHVIVKGPVHDAELLQRQVLGIIREIRKAEKGDPKRTD